MQPNKLNKPEQINAIKTLVATLALTLLVTACGGGGGGAAAVPEPSSVAMMGVICGGAGYRRWRKRRSAANVA